MNIELNPPLVIINITLLCLVFIAGLAIGRLAEQNKFEKEAVARGYAEFDPETTKWNWK